MENELLKIFDDHRKHIGFATRDEVHRLGYWHETFHCWFIGKYMNTNYIYLQLRSNTKKDYPNLFDITAAGHILADESIQEGTREIIEEIGIEVSFGELTPLGVIDYCMKIEDFIDKELAQVFLYKYNKSFDDFIFQKEEVAGMVKIKFTDFEELWLGKRDTVHIKGLKISDDGSTMLIDKHVGMDRFVPHPHKFYLKVIQRIKEHI